MSTPRIDDGPTTPVDWIKDPMMAEGRRARVLYTNHRGETSWRRVVPLPSPPELCGPDHPHHPGRWAVRVWDLDRDAERTYCLNDVHWWLSEPDAARLTERELADRLDMIVGAKGL